jgi:hypothetical protein
MIVKSDLSDEALRAAFAGDAAEVAGIDVTSTVRARLYGRRRRGLVRAVPVPVVVIAAVILGGGTALAVGNATGLIRIHFQPAPLSGPGAPVNVVLDPPFTTTVVDAQARGGFHVRVLTGLATTTLDVVRFVPPITSMNGQPFRHNSGAVDLSYTFGATTLEVVEQLDTDGAAAPLDVVFKQFPALPPDAAQRLIAPGVERINGNDYLVLRSIASGHIVAIEWKMPDGVIMLINVHSADGVDTATATTLIEHLK